MAFNVTSGAALAVEYNSNLYEVRNRIQNAVERTREITSRLRRKSDQLIGPMPVKGSSENPSSREAERSPLISEINTALLMLDAALTELDEQSGVIETI